MLGREGREGGAVALVEEVAAVGAADAVDVEDMAVDVVAGDDNAVPKGQVIRMLLFFFSDGLCCSLPAVAPALSQGLGGDTDAMGNARKTQCCMKRCPSNDEVCPRALFEAFKIEN